MPLLLCLPVLSVVAYTEYNMANEVSYRQVGREKGYVPLRKLKDDRTQRQASGNKRDAFGNRTERFSKMTVRLACRSFLYYCDRRTLQHTVYPIMRSGLSPRVAQTCCCLHSSRLVYLGMAVLPVLRDELLTMLLRYCCMLRVQQQ